MNDEQLETNQHRSVALATHCWFLTGATAGGKTTVGMELARRLDAEIISLDSMTVYREMDIGTAKPSPEQREAVPHHLIDLCDPTETFSVSQYRELAVEAIESILERGRTPLFVGGTALYLKVLLRGMFEGPPADWQFRREVEEEIERVGLEPLHQRLQMIDPVAAHKLHATDRRRIIRALEVHRLTGRPISHWQREFDEGRPAGELRVFTLVHPRDVLHRRIERRVDWMLDHGLIDEVQGLLDKYNELSRTAAQAVGYRECITYLRGELAWDDLNEAIRVRTRRFARHQETWFRGLSECRLIDVADPFDPQDVVETILSLGGQVPNPSQI